MNWQTVFLSIFVAPLIAVVSIILVDVIFNGEAE